jgi:hypothetical protein
MTGNLIGQEPKLFTLGEFIRKICKKFSENLALAALWLVQAS